MICLDELFYKYKSFKKLFIDEFNDVKDKLLNKSEVILNYIHRNVILFIIKISFRIEARR